MIKVKEMQMAMGVVIKLKITGARCVDVDGVAHHIYTHIRVEKYKEEGGKCK